MRNVGRNKMSFRIWLFRASEDCLKYHYPDSAVSGSGITILQNTIKRQEERVAPLVSVVQIDTKQREHQTLRNSTKLPSLLSVVIFM